jgi:hypothetical protein
MMMFLLAHLAPSIAQIRQLVGTKQNILLPRKKNAS